MRNALVLSLLTIGLYSCQNDSDFQEVITPEIQEFNSVDRELWTYFSDFEQEALERGFRIDLNALDIVGIIDEIDQNNVAGQCSYSSHFPNRITLDETFWNNSGSNFREFVVFHELGHCVLGRGHDESTDARGFCQSIMRSGTLGCRDRYNITTRENYLDELFFETD